MADKFKAKINNKKLESQKPKISLSGQNDIELDEDPGNNDWTLATALKTLDIPGYIASPVTSHPQGNKKKIKGKFTLATRTGQVIKADEQLTVHVDLPTQDIGPYAVEVIA